MSVFKSKIITSDGRCWFFRFRFKDINGIRHDYTSKKYFTKKEAIEAEALKIIEFSKNPVSKNSITFKTAFQHYVNMKQVKKQTILKEYNLFKHLKPIENDKISSFDKTRYYKYKLYLDGLDLSLPYKNKILGLLKRIIIYSSKYFNTSTVIISFIENYKNVNEFKKEMDFFTYEEYQLFRSKIDNPNYAAFFDLMFYMGLRVGETQGLTFKDFDITRKEININKTLTTKIKGEKWTISTPKTKNSIRALPLPQNLVNELIMIKNDAKKYKNYSDDWFIFGYTHPFPESTITKYKNDYCDAASLRHIRIHDFRHSCASYLINYLNASITLVSRFLGHSSIKITIDTYTHIYHNQLQELADLMNKN